MAPHASVIHAPSDLARPRARRRGPAHSRTTSRGLARPGRALPFAGHVGSSFMLAALAVFTTACEAGRAGASDAVPDAAQSLAPTSRMQDGVRILEHAADALDRAPRLTLDSIPVAVLGGARADPAFDLTYAAYAALLSDGRVVTLAPVGNRLLAFGADGRGQRALAQRGNGPGDIMAPSYLALIRGDSLVVPDRANQRINWVLADRGIVQQRPLPGSFRALPVPKVAGMLGDGRFVMHSSGLVQQSVSSDGVERPPTRLVTYNPADTSLVVIAELPDLELRRVETRYRGSRRQGVEVLRLTRQAHAVVWDTLVVTGIGDGYSLDLRTGDGRIVSRLQMARPRRAVTEAMREAQRRMEADRFSSRVGEGAVDSQESLRLIREAPYADSLAPYSALHVTPNGTLWVVDEIAPTDSTWSATAFRADGAIIGRLHGRGRPVPMTFGDDRVVLRTEDEDGVVSLRVHRIVPALRAR